jgi:hypothetical protein
MKFFMDLWGCIPNTSLHLTARTRGAFPKAVGAAGELVVSDNNKAIILEAKKVNNSKRAMDWLDRAAAFEKFALGD